MRKTSDYKKVIRETAKELGVPEYVVHDVAHSMFSTVAEDIKRGTLKGTKVQYLGKFVVKPSRRELFEEEVLGKDV